ncbi:universal stress protein [Streptomyces sp. NPDC126514]|uniref:universal stress protein n=1 Tax=Streptomyces sp. NPDC126514 TaxID=3155210 RepID=UPI003328ACD2
MTGPVVVGLDASPSSATALRWAARAALDRGLPVLLLHSWATQPLDVPVPQGQNGRYQGREVLRHAAAGLLRRHPDLAVATELVRGPAAQALLDRAEEASMLVLGSRGHGSAAGFLLGSVALDVLGLAPCPAVSVRAGLQPTGTGEIVVGTAHRGAAADPLLEFAFTMAAGQGRGVRAVATTAGTEAATRARLADALAPWREKFPDVPVTERTASGPPEQALPAACSGGWLAVVGRRRGLPQQAWRLGAVAHAALHHVPCPVAVVPYG